MALPPEKRLSQRRQVNVEISLPIHSSSSEAAGVSSLRHYGASVGATVEVLQHGGVGSLEQPLLAWGGGVTQAHEDSPLTGVAVDTAVTDGVVETFVLEDDEKETHQRKKMF